MKLHRLKVPTEPSHSFSLRQNRMPNSNNRRQYHADVERIHCQRGTGTQFVGDPIKRFGPGDTVLVGVNLPYYWWRSTMWAAPGSRARPWRRDTIMQRCRRLLRE